jgi:hypothetical protein
MCLPGPRCLHEYFGGLHGRCPNGVVVSPGFRTSVPVVTKLDLGSVATEPPEAHMHHFGPVGNNCFIGNTCRGRVICLNRAFWLGPTQMRVCLWGIISLAITKRAASSDLAAEAITNLMIWVIERTAPLNCGNGVFSERKMCAPAQLQELVSLRNPASKWAQRTMSLAQ